MLGKMVHRGPDSHSEHYSPLFTAGMRRLSINDLHSGEQPFYSGDQSIIMFYNGEIYNSPALRAELEADGARFRSSCDGEVVCHLYERHGKDAFSYLDGMYAIALWDSREKELVLARDIPGEKPLYYTRTSDGIAFASEIKSLIQFPGLDLSFDHQALWDLPTFSWIPEPATIYASIKALPRGHMLVAKGRDVRLHEIENRFAPSLEGMDEAALIAQIRETVTNAVHSRLLSDVPVGSFLSGGLDSSIVATLASRKLDALTTFTIGFEDVSDPYHGRADESAQAEATAKWLGTKHHTIRVTADDFLERLEQYCVYGDLPWSVPSGLGILTVAEKARECGIKVLLSGDCADECFGGYSWYPLLPQLGAKNSGHLTDFTLSLHNKGVSPADFVRQLNTYSLPVRACAFHYYASEADKRRLFSPEVTAELSSSARFFEQLSGSPEDFIRHDRNFYLPFEMLRKVDRMGMAHSIEGRPPFAAPSVIGLADQLGFDSMVRGETLKWMLRKAFEDILPKEVTQRPKHGFNVPVDRWLRHEWAHLLEEAFSPDSALMREGLVSADALQQARLMLADPKRLHGTTLFTFITLNIWLEKVHYGNHS